MTKTRLVIGFKYLPTRFPIFQTIVLFLLLDRLHASGTVWGIVGTLAGIVWIGTIYNYFTEKGGEPVFRQE